MCSTWHLPCDTRTAVLSKTSHANCHRTLTIRPSRGRRGRFVRVVQQLACEVFARTAVSDDNIGHGENPLRVVPRNPHAPTRNSRFPLGVKLFQHMPPVPVTALPCTYGLTAGKLLVVRNQSGPDALCRTCGSNAGDGAAPPRQSVAVNKNPGVKTSHLQRPPSQVHAAVTTLDAPDTSCGDKDARPHSGERAGHRGARFGAPLCTRRTWGVGVSATPPPTPPRPPPPPRRPITPPLRAPTATAASSPPRPDTATPARAWHRAVGGRGLLADPPVLGLFFVGGGAAAGAREWNHHTAARGARGPAAVCCARWPPP